MPVLFSKSGSNLIIALYPGRSRKITETSVPLYGLAASSSDQAPANWVLADSRRKMKLQKSFLMDKRGKMGCAAVRLLLLHINLCQLVIRNVGRSSMMLPISDSSNCGHKDQPSA